MRAPESKTKFLRPAGETRLSKEFALWSPRQMSLDRGSLRIVGEIHPFIGVVLQIVEFLLAVDVAEVALAGGSAGDAAPLSKVVVGTRPVALVWSRNRGRRDWPSRRLSTWM